MASRWLDAYRSLHYQWQSQVFDERTTFCRPLGVVENAFDHDGTDFEGRADVTTLFTLDVRNNLSQHELRERIILAWACTRLKHVLMSATVVGKPRLSSSDTKSLSHDRYFLIRCPASVNEAIQEAKATLTYVEDVYPSSAVDPLQLYKHAMNTARVIDHEKALARCFVLPLEPHPAGIKGLQRLRFLSVAAHAITDGISTYNTHLQLVHLLNSPNSSLLHQLSHSIQPSTMEELLPPPQEALYPPIHPNSTARQRWFWAITRVLRHTRRKPPDPFENPLRRREGSLHESRALEPKFAKLFDYSLGKKPPLNSFVQSARLSPRAARRVQKLCRDVGVSIGSGCFALCALAMMSLHESLHLKTPEAVANETRHFVGSFPLNPRPFLHTPTEVEKRRAVLPSLMLAFSDGLHLPFLPSHLNLEGRFRLLARQANRQLRVYQKGSRASKTQPIGLTHPTMLLPSNFLAASERVEAKVPLHRKSGINPQGAYSAIQGSGATCGISSIGSRSIFTKGVEYDLSDEAKDFVASFVDLGPSVRVRDGECLVGSAGDQDGLYLSASFDGNALDEELLERWKEVVEEMFEEDLNKGSRL